jgi:hypothetical protein
MGLHLDFGLAVLIYRYASKRLSGPHQNCTSDPDPQQNAAVPVSTESSIGTFFRFAVVRITFLQMDFLAIGGLLVHQL